MEKSKIIGIQSAKRYNRLRIIYLLLLVPFILFIILYILTLLLGGTLDVIIKVLLIYILFLVIGYFEQREMILNLRGIKKISREKYYRLYNIVENLTISRGLILPHILIMEDDSINSFSTSIGWGRNNYYIIFSMGIFDNLTDKEIEAMVAHEITHILAGDSKVMFLTSLLIFPIVIFKQLIYYDDRLRSKLTKIIFLPILLLGEFLLLMVNLSISKKREYLADIGSIELMKDKDALISAIKKASKNPRIELPITLNSATSSMFFYNPKRESLTFPENISSYPSLSDRIEMINNYYK